MREHSRIGLASSRIDVVRSRRHGPPSPRDGSGDWDMPATAEARPPHPFTRSSEPERQAGRRVEGRTAGRARELGPDAEVPDNARRELEPDTDFGAHDG